MKLHIELDPGLYEDEIHILCRSADETIRRIQRFILEQAGGPKLSFFKGSEEYFFPLEDLLFFETDGDAVFAHTGSDAFRVRQRLYELEETLPRAFIRASKGCIVNLAQVYSITRDLSSSSLVRFTGSHKQVFLSRRYYRALKERLNERGIGHET
ncbi:MAG: LytTR family transcriptional regulator [Christensenellaceae bacterium]|nr:LytTR family transcriptional regulator [Christensenellaceae bacterium]